MEPVAMTTKEACKRYLGLKATTLKDMCLRKQIKATKVCNKWFIPVAELDRVFLGIKPER
jgi:excisionase family DNA binding protein